MPSSRAVVVVGGASVTMTSRRSRARRLSRRRASFDDDAGSGGDAATPRVTVTFVDAWTGEERVGRGEIGVTNVLALAESCGAIEVNDDFCLEGRCGTCSMEALGNDDDGDGAPRNVVLGCRTTVGEDGRLRFRVGCGTTPRFGDDTTWSM
jgi:hypothetical protein